jgi:hypothetical protein
MNSPTSPWIEFFARRCFDFIHGLIATDVGT